MKYCENCGSELIPNAKFCTSCGAPVPAAPDVSGSAPEDNAPEESGVSKGTFSYGKPSDENKPENTAEEEPKRTGFFSRFVK